MRRPLVKSKGFTLIEVLIVLALILTLALVLLPALARPRMRSSRINCTNHMKQIGLAFKTWAIDNNDLYPMEVSVTRGGAMEALATNLPLVFQVMSNELSTPKILVCPADSKRVNASDFANLKRANISYFVGMDATDTNPACILSGDRNITNGMGVRARILYVTTNDPAGWSPGPHNLFGNLLLSDGSVQQDSTARLREAIANTGFPTNRLLMP